MIRLYINVDHVATVREARKTDEPDPLAASILAELAGADGITVHLREDRRHIQDRDVARIRESIKTSLNLEMAPTDEMVNIALNFKPYQVSLVPEKRQEITTEGGLDVVGQKDLLNRVRSEFKEMGVLFSLFVDPDQYQLDACKELEADSIEINTGRYAEAKTEKLIQKELIKIQQSARHASELGLRVFAGHGLTTKNVVAIAAISEIEELNIGHNIVARSVYVGIEKAVKEMRFAIERGIRLRKS